MPATDLDTGLGPSDFQAQIANTRKRAEIETGTVTEHHASWDDQGIEVSELLGSLEASGQGQKAKNLNMVLWEIPWPVKSIDTFVDQLGVRVSGAIENTAEVDSLITYVQNWNNFVGELESGTNAVPLSIYANDPDLHDYLDKHAGSDDVTAAMEGIKRYKESFVPDLGYGTCSI